VTAPESITYELSHWPARSRDMLRWLLQQNGVGATWQPASFSVPVSEQAQVDHLIATLSGAGNGALPTTGPAAGAAIPGVRLHQAAVPVAPAGWYADPAQQFALRWWDGTRWTEHVSAQRVYRGWFPPPDDRAQAARGGGIALVGFIGGQVLSIALVLAAIVLGASSRSVVTLIVGELGLWAGLFGACKLAVRRYGSGSLRDLGLVRLQGADFGIGSIAALVARVGTLILAAIVVILFSLHNLARDTSVTDEAGISTLGAVVVTLIAVVGAPFFEELYFRGLVQGVLTRRYGSRVAIGLQSVAFGLVHYQIGMTADQAVLTFTMIIPVGLLLGILRWRYERLGPGMVAHAVFNAIAVAVTLAVA
jgi:membrane protease YdiL (CAAX protease family)